MEFKKTSEIVKRDRIRWLRNHKVWNRRAYVGNSIDIEYVHVNPFTETVEDDDSLNTAFRVWLESGPPHDQSKDKNVPPPQGGWNKYNKWMRSHDIRLDCGAPILDAALLKLADLVEKFYNEDGSDRNNVIDTSGARSSAVRAVGS